MIDDQNSAHYRLASMAIAMTTRQKQQRQDQRCNGERQHWSQPGSSVTVPAALYVLTQKCMSQIRTRVALCCVMSRVALNRPPVSTRKPSSKCQLFPCLGELVHVPPDAVKPCLLWVQKPMRYAQQHTTDSTFSGGGGENPAAVACIGSRLGHCILPCVHLFVPACWSQMLMLCGQ